MFVFITSDLLWRRTWFFETLLGVRGPFQWAIKLQNPWSSGVLFVRSKHWNLELSCPEYSNFNGTWPLTFNFKLNNFLPPIRVKLGVGHNPVCRVRIWGLVLPETGLCGLKIGFLRNGPIFEVAPICAKIDLRYHWKALSSNSSFICAESRFF